MDSVRSVALGLLDRHGLVRRGRARGRPVAPARAHAVPRHRPLRLAGDRPALRRAWAPSSTRAPARRRRRSTRACSTCTSPRRSTSWPTWSGARASPRTNSTHEREIVLEEIAMYEDDPQDKVFDVLGEAVFGEHPLGRAIIGRARGRRAARPRRRCGPSTSARYVPAQRRHRGGRLGRPRRARRARRGAPSAARAGARAPALPAPPAGRRRAAHAVRRKDTEQYHVCLGAPGHRRATTSAASRCASSTTILGGTSSSRLFQEVREQRGPGVQRLLVPVHVRRAPARSACTSARGPTTSARRMGVVADELERLRAGPGHRRGARALQGERQGADRAVARVDDGADEPPGRVGAGRACRC